MPRGQAGRACQLQLRRVARPQLQLRRGLLPADGQLLQYDHHHVRRVELLDRDDQGARLRRSQVAERAAEGRTFANLKPRGVAVLEYVRSLRCEYGHLALFFYDRHGGNTVALKWRPRAFLPLPFRPDDALGRLLVPRAAVDAAGASHAAWLLPNVQCCVVRPCCECEK